MATSGPQVFSKTQPAFAGGPSTPLYKAMQEYANHPNIQSITQALFADLVSERPEDPLRFISQWVDKERAKRGVVIIKKVAPSS